MVPSGLFFSCSGAGLSSFCSGVVMLWTDCFKQQNIGKSMSKKFVTAIIDDDNAVVVLAIFMSHIIVFELDFVHIKLSLKPMHTRKHG